jgi:hypothetical protein
MHHAGVVGVRYSDSGFDKFYGVGGIFILQWIIAG